MGMVACAGEIENKKQDIFCVIQSTHNNYSADSLVLYALQVKIILYYTGSDGSCSPFILYMYIHV